jgi:hypothetical protein
MMGAAKAHYEVAEKTEATIHGGIALAHRVAVVSGLIAAINKRVGVLKIHCPYYESDHILNIAFNAMCGGHPRPDDGRRLLSTLPSGAYPRADGGDR